MFVSLPCNEAAVVDTVDATTFSFAWSTFVLASVYWCCVNAKAAAAEVEEVNDVDEPNRRSRVLTLVHLLLLFFIAQILC